MGRVGDRWMLSAALLVVACAPGPPAGPAPAASGPPPILMETVRLDGYRAGRLELQVRAARASIDADRRRAQLERVRIEFEDSASGPIEVHAERGWIELDGNDFVLSGRVEGQVGEGQRFRTADVRYRDDPPRLWTDQPVEVIRSNLVLEGDGMEIDLDKRVLKIKGNVHTRLGGR